MFIVDMLTLLDHEACRQLKLWLQFQNVTGRYYKNEFQLFQKLCYAVNSFYCKCWLNKTLLFTLPCLEGASSGGSGRDVTRQ